MGHFERQATIGDHGLHYKLKYTIDPAGGKVRLLTWTSEEPLEGDPYYWLDRDVSVSRMTSLIDNYLWTLRYKGHPHDRAAYGDPYKLAHQLARHLAVCEKIDASSLHYILNVPFKPEWCDVDGYYLHLTPDRIRQLLNYRKRVASLFGGNDDAAYVQFWDHSGDWVSNGEEMWEDFANPALDTPADGSSYEGGIIYCNPELLEGEDKADWAVERSECDLLNIDKEGFFWTAYPKNSEGKMETERLTWQELGEALLELGGGRGEGGKWKACAVPGCMSEALHSRGLSVCKACHVAMLLYTIKAPASVEVYVDPKDPSLTGRRPRTAPGGTLPKPYLSVESARNIPFCKNEVCPTLNHCWDGSARGTWVEGYCPQCSRLPQFQIMRS